MADMSKQAPDVSVVMPCLNEEATIAKCVQEAWQALEEAGVRGEVIVADNGSTDQSAEIARAEGARVVEVEHLGYGSALRAGLTESHAPLLVFLDADMSYDFSNIPRFVEKLHAGSDLVIGSRMSGTMDPGAMPVSHRLIGTPVMTFLANTLFHCGISDINCGMRGLTREAFERLNLHSNGMEFASEMMIKAALAKMRIVEIPIDFHTDQRGHEPHLRSFRDGWRHLQLMLHFSPVGLLLAPGSFLMALGFALILGGRSLDNPALAFLLFFGAVAASSLGTEILLLGLIAQGRIRGSKYEHLEGRYHRFMIRFVRLERGMLLGLLAMGAGIALTIYDLSGTIPASGGGSAEAGAPFEFARATIAQLGTLSFLCGLQVFFVSIFMGLFGIRVASESDGRPAPRRAQP